MKKIYIFFSIIFLFIIFLNPRIIKDQSSNQIVKFKNLEADLELQISSFLFKKKYQGILNYEKSNKISLNINYKNEFIDLGSNPDYFWYYSTYENVLYYGKLSDVNWLIKEIFSPYNIIQILFIEKVDIKNGIIEDTIIGNYGVKLKRKLLIKDNLVYEHKVYENNNLIYTVEVLEYKDGIPVKVSVFYVKENYRVAIRLSNVKFNSFEKKFIIPFTKYENKFLLTP